MEKRAETNRNVAIIVAPDGRGLQKIFGIPAARRLILLGQQVGFDEIHVMGDVGALLPVLSDLIPPERFYPIHDPASLRRAVEKLSLSDWQKAIILKANLVIDRAFLARLTGASNPSDFQSPGAEGEKDTDGVFLVHAADLASILSHLWSPSHTTQLQDKTRAARVDLGLSHLLNGEQDQAKLAEDMLMRALALQTENEDGFLARNLDRPVSRFISKRLAGTAVTPNQITIAGTALGLTSAFLLSQPGYWFHLAGAFLFLICVVVDGVDGEVARLKLQETIFGHYLDVVTDNIVHVAIFTGIALGLYRDTENHVFLRFLWVLIGGFGLCCIAVYQCILRRSAEELRRSVNMIRIMALLSNRDFAYLIFILAVVGRLDWFLVGAAAGTYLFAAILWATNHYEKRARAH
ncbi:MAG: CDP-alcohol phosphatidyltransferase family protein [Syntrophales bacterium LBB04]|nr:CDP-alcohol phosphatidyltransferase family protein [Syntrophales bacterium LBB04]